VLFDWSGTLFHDAVRMPELITTAAKHVGKPVSPREAQELARALRAAESDPGVIAAERDRDRSAAAHRNAHRVRLRAAGIRDDELVDAIYDLFLTRSVRPYPDTERALREVWRLGVPVAVVSNCGRDIRRDFAEHGLDGYVMAFALSFEHGAVKPEPRLFQVACQLLGVEAKDALMVGDDPVSDGGAVRAGIAALILPAVPAGTRRGLEVVVRLLGSEPEGVRRGRNSADLIDG
jgi:putative hydrolase of the HAD superfamily